MSQFAMNFRASLEGRMMARSMEDLNFKSAVSAISDIFHQVFAPSIEAIDALDGLSDEYIRRAIDNTNDLPPTLFIPERAFHLLVKEQIARLEQPGSTCVDLIHEALLSTASHMHVR